MPARKIAGPNAKTRLERVTEVAREAGCDEDETASKEKLWQVARFKPVPQPPKRSLEKR
jgi:hypothetical protein